MRKIGGVWCRKLVDLIDRKLEGNFCNKYQNMMEAECNI